MFNRLQSPRTHGRGGQPNRSLEFLEARQVPSALLLVADTVTTNAAYIEAVYQDVLGRPADVVGLDWAAEVVNSGQPHANLVVPLVFSEEANAQFIRSVYQQYLGRAADAAGINYWLGQMQAG